MMQRLGVEFLGLELNSPLVLTSGVLGTSAELLRRVASLGAGMVTTKSLSMKEREGHDNPTVLDFGAGIINAVGLSNPGIENMDEEWDGLLNVRVPLIVSIFSDSVEGFVETAEAVASRRPGIIELNVSCPNTGAHGQLFGKEPEVVSQVVEAVKEVTKGVPLMPKLTPNVKDIREIAGACEDAGADAISAINTVGPGMLIDVEAGKPVLNYLTGGLSGPAIRPIAVRCVYDIYEEVSLPVLGIGGVVSGRDCLEMMMAGAGAVGIGSAVYYKGIEVFQTINAEVEKWLEQEGYGSLEEVVGAAHR